MRPINRFALIDLVVTEIDQCKVVEDFLVKKIKMSGKTYKLPIIIVFWTLIIGFTSKINGIEFQCSKFFTNCKCGNGTEISVRCKNLDGIDKFRLKPPRLEIRCSGSTPLNQMYDILPRIKVGQFANELYIENCVLAENLSFRQILFHFDISRLRTIRFSINRNFVLHSKQLRNLDGVESIYLDGPITFDINKSPHIRLDPAIDRSGGGLFAEPFNGIVAEMSLEDSSFSVLEIGITNNTNSEKLSRALSKYSMHLERVYFMKNDVRTLDQNLFGNSKNLRNLSLKNNNMETLPDHIFRNQQKLIELDLSFNRLKTLKSVIFEYNQRLIVLSLSHNQLEHIPKDLLNRLPALEEFYLDNNQLKTINYEASSSLKIVGLSNNLLTRFWRPSNKNLTKLDLSGNRIEHLDLGEIILIRNGSFTIDLSKNWIRSIYDNNTAHEFITTELKKYAIAMKRSDIQWNWVLNDNPLNCDCRILHFSNILNECADIRKYLNLITNKLECNATGKLNGKLISQVQQSDLLCPYNCSMIADKPAACECWYRSFDKVLIVNCSNAALTKVPDLFNLSNKSHRIELIIANNDITTLSSVMMPANVYKINAENNSIRMLNAEGLSRFLRELNLAGNDLQTLDRSILSRLNGTLNKLELQRNPWECECNSDFMNYLRLHANKVDYTNIKCFDGKSLNETEQMCSQNFNILLIVFTIAGFLIGGLIALYYKFEQEIKIWLFAHQICLCIVKEHEIDKDKKYDAFISYSHIDEEFVCDLVLKLESGPNPFKICINTRDWIAGDYIADQIATSVKNSRRTIVVLTKDFLKSVWGKMEFRAAHKLALKEGRARLIVVIRQDIEDNEQFFPELSLYLKTNTYLKWDDPYFYDKLYYALPHTPRNCRAKRHN